MYAGLTLVVHALAGLSIRRLRLRLVIGRVHVTAVVLGQRLLRHTGRRGRRVARGLVADGRQAAAGVGRAGRGGVGAALRIGVAVLRGRLGRDLSRGAALLVLGLARGILLLLALLPLLADLLEFCRYALALFRSRLYGSPLQAGAASGRGRRLEAPPPIKADAGP